MIDGDPENRRLLYSEVHSAVLLVNPRKSAHPEWHQWKHKRMVPRTNLFHVNHLHQSTISSYHGSIWTSPSFREESLISLSHIPHS